MATFANKARYPTCFVLVVCLGLAHEGRAGAPAASTTTAIFTNVPPDIAVRSRLRGAEIPPPCSFFTVRLSASGKRVVLTTSGLGEAKMAPAPSGGCPSARGGWNAEIKLTERGPQRVALKLLPQPDRPPERAGQIIALGPDGVAGSADVVIRRLPPLPLWPELKWFVGFIVPAFLTFLLGRYTVRQAERRKEHADLVVFRTVHKDKVDALIHDAAATVADPRFARPGLQILQTLRAQEIIANLPNADKERLVQSCERDEIVQTAKQLARLFPLHGPELEKALRERDKKLQGG